MKDKNNYYSYTETPNLKFVGEKMGFFSAKLLHEKGQGSGGEGGA